jgi:RHS repeat-associated protein
MLENSIVYYVLGDHPSASLRAGLGSTSLIINNTAGLYGENRYKAFGETRYTSGTIPTTFGFTGQRQESGLGLSFYNARWYDPALGRFVQADILVPDPYNPQSLNRYSYVRNNPLKYIDPTGHEEGCPGTEKFISVQTGDGGISWASCWAIQRDKNILSNVGVSNKAAEFVAVVLDALGTYDATTYLTGPGYIRFADLVSRKDRNEENDEGFIGPILSFHNQIKEQERKQTKDDGKSGVQIDLEGLGRVYDSAFLEDDGEGVKASQVVQALTILVAKNETLINDPEFKSEISQAALEAKTWATLGCVPNGGCPTGSYEFLPIPKSVGWRINITIYNGPQVR